MSRQAVHIYLLIYTSWGPYALGQGVDAELEEGGQGVGRKEDGAQALSACCSPPCPGSQEKGRLRYGDHEGGLGTISDFSLSSQLLMETVGSDIRSCPLCQLGFPVGYPDDALIKHIDSHLENSKI